jgi:hypothetical protein
MMGNVAGVQMAKLLRTAGSNITFPHPCICSINAGNSPLIILDGTPYDVTST